MEYSINNMENICILIKQASEWLLTVSEPPVIFSQYFTKQSRTRPWPYFSLSYQASGEYDWWKAGDNKYKYPNGHIKVSCNNQGGQSAVPKGNVGVWYTTFDVSNIPEFDNFMNNIFISKSRVLNPNLTINRFKKVANLYLEPNKDHTTYKLRFKAALLELLAHLSSKSGFFKKKLIFS